MKYVKIIIINCVIFLSLFMALEFGSRIFWDKKDFALFNMPDMYIAQRNFIEADKELGFVLRKKYKDSFYSINSSGFRGAEFPLDLADKTCILTLGESTTFGWGVKNGEDYPSILMQLFKANNQDVYVINGGVPSYSSSQVLLKLKRIIANKKIEPEVILVNILWNDIWYSAIANWHSNILVYQRLPKWLRIFATKSNLLRDLLSRRIKGNMRMNIFNQQAYDKYKKNIEKIAIICKRNKIKLFFMQPPINFDMMWEQGLGVFDVGYTKKFFLQISKKHINAMREIANKYQVSIIEHRLSIAYLHQNDLFLDMLHPTATGNYMMAEDVYVAIEGNF